MTKYSAATVVLLCIASSVVTLLTVNALGPGQSAPADVPSVVGLTIEQARKLTDAAGLLLILDQDRVPESDQIPPGTVLDQKPLGGSRMRAGDAIHATLAAAPVRTRVPALIDQNLEAARHSLEEAGLRLGKVTETASPTLPPGQVIESRPGPGTELRKGDVVHVTLSKGSDSVVPSLRGMSAGAAKAAIERAGFSVGAVRVGEDDNAADGVVLRQTPAPGTQAQKGQKIDIVVNSGT